MAHLVFQASQIPTAAAANNAFSFHSVALLSPRPLSSPSVAVGKVWKATGEIKCSSAPVPTPTAEEDSRGLSKAALERCFRAPPVPPPSCSGDSDPSMKGGKKRVSSGQLILEKGKLDVSSKRKFKPKVELEGGGGGLGKNLFHGGGDGGDDDGGDDDDYYDDFDEDDDDGDEGGFFRKKKLFKELFDRKFVDAVLDEWQKTMMDLPAGFRQAYEMGLISSAQMVRLLAINARPTIARTVSRCLPNAISREFIGRMLADPAFLYKFLLEQAASVGFTVWMEVINRKDRLKKEWDLALLNVLTVTACNAFVVWSLAPCRSYGNTFRFDLQNTLQKLPNNIFEKSYPLREFDIQKRIHSFFFKSAELCLVGMTAGAVQGSLSSLMASRKEDRLSVTLPSFSTSALGYGAFLGLYANLRYQFLCGLDQAMVNHFDVIGVALGFSTALRLLNSHVGETSRLAWLGVEADPMADSAYLSKAYIRRSETSPSKWFISKKALVSALGLLGIKQRNGDMGDSETPAPKARRKRIVRKKVTA